MSTKLCEILGYSPEELISREFDSSPIRKTSRTWICCSGCWPAKCRRWRGRVTYKSGSVVWMKLTSALLRTEGGAPDYFITVIEDISERSRPRGRVACALRGNGATHPFQIANPDRRGLRA